MGAKFKILFLGANPSNTTRLALGKEVREITQRLRSTSKADRFELVQEWAVRAGDLQAALLHHEPQFVHFSGHGGAKKREAASIGREMLPDDDLADADGALWLEDEAGNAKPIPAPALARLFGLVGGIRCVVLNACYSAAQAQAIGQQVEAVIGMRRSISDDSAIMFSSAFYQALGFGKPITRAFNLGINQIELYGLDEHDVPQLLIQERQRIAAPEARIEWNDEERQDPFLLRVEHVAKLRHPNARIECKSTHGPFAGILHVDNDVGGFFRPSIVGALNASITDELAEHFRSEIHDPMRQKHPQLWSTLVHLGHPAPMQLRKQFDQAGIELRTFENYQGIFDLQPYIEWQNRELEKNQSYSPVNYVDPPAWVKIAGSHDRVHTANALQTMVELLSTHEHRRFLLVLGEFGAGKTFLMRELYRHLVHTKHTLVPVLLEMSKLEKQHSLQELLGAHFARADVPGYDFKAFEYLLSAGRIALLFDGFDELADKVTYESATQHLDTVLSAVHGQAKVILSSRRQHFLTEGGIHEAVEREFARRAESAVQGGYRLLMLEPFGEPQIRRYLRNVLQDEIEAEARYRLLDEVKDLIGLSHNPRMLSFIAEIPEASLRAAKEQWGEITAAKLYELLVKRWLDFEYDRARRQGTSKRISRFALSRGVEALALFMWHRRTEAVNMQEIHEGIAYALGTFGEGPLDADVLTHRFGSASLLQRDSEGQFSFVHRSVMEWLVAKQAAADVSSGNDPQSLLTDEMSALMADFFASMTGREAVVTWARQKLAHTHEPALRKNATLVLTRLGERLQEVNFEGEDLRGRDFSGVDWRGANLRWVDLRGATLKGADLRGASLIGATLAHADLRDANLTRAELAKADFSFVRARGTDFSFAAPFDPQRFRGANLLGAKGIPEERRDELVTAGAASIAIRHVEPVWAAFSSCNCIAWNSSGSILAIGHVDGRIRLVDGIGGRVLRVLSGHLGAIRWLAFSPEEQTLASCSEDKTIRLWDISRGRTLRILYGHEAMVQCAAFSPNGDTLASGSDDRTLRVWDVSTGRARHVVDSFSSPIQTVAFAPNGSTIASGSARNGVVIWEVAPGRSENYNIENASVHSVAFSADGLECAASCSDGIIRVFDLRNRQVRAIVADAVADPFRVALSYDGHVLGIGTIDNTSPHWQLAANRSLQALQAEAQQLYEVAFADALLPTISNLRSHVQTAALRRTLREYQGRHVSIASVAFSPNGHTIASGSDDKVARLWSVTGQSAPRQLVGHNRGVRCVAFLPDGETLASASLDKTIRLWSVRTGETFCILDGHTDAIHSMAVSPDGQVIASGSQDKTVRVCDITGGMVRVFRGHSMLVHCVAFSPDGHIVASSSHDKTIRFWNIHSGASAGVLKGPSSVSLSISFSPTGRILASAASNSAVYLWDTTTNKIISTLDGHTAAVRCVAFSHTGGALVTGSSDTTARLWSVARGYTIRAFEGHTAAITSVAFSPNDELLATSSADNTIRIWDIETGECLAILLAAPEGWVAFTPDGRYKFGGNITGSFWHVAGLCRFDPGELDDLLPLRIADAEPLFSVI